MNPSEWLGKPDVFKISKQDLNKYFSLREIQGISPKWLKVNKQWVKKYLEYVDYKIDEQKTFSYCKSLKDKISVVSFRKRVYQIRKFLEYMDIDWSKKIKLPPEPYYHPDRISIKDIHKTLEFFKEYRNFKQIKALIYIGAFSGLRAEEIYQLEPKNIDLDASTIFIEHNPINGKTTKTRRSRITFFNDDTKMVLMEYLDYFNNGSELKVLFSKSRMNKQFNQAPLKIKQLRKFFSQEWDRRGGATSIKKILMGHSLKGDVDLQHYNAQSEEDLKRIYDKVMS